MVVIHHGIEHIELERKEDARALLPSRAQKARHVIGTVAELHHIKGLSYAIEAMHALRDLDVAYVIWGEGEERGALESLVKTYNIDDRVFLPGSMKDAGIHMKAFDSFLLPSLSEALGYVILEAGRAELPVIATSVGGIPEIVADMESGLLIHPRNSREIERAVRFLMSDETKAKMLGTHLRETVNREFSIKRMTEETAHLYRNDS